MIRQDPPIEREQWHPKHAPSQKSEAAGTHIAIEAFHMPRRCGMP
jgi:hypothetical protein